MRVYVYVLRSSGTGKRYVGISKFKLKRLRQHQRGQSVATRSKGPWVEIMREGFDGYAEARAREKFLKSGIGREWLEVMGA